MKKSGHHSLAHAGIYLIARGLPGIVAFLAIPLFSRMLSPEEYGRYALVIATMNLVNSLLFQWLRIALVRYLPSYSENPTQLKSTIASTSFLITLLLGIVAALMYVAPITPSWKPLIWPCWMLIGVQSVFEVCGEYHRAGLRPWHYMRLQVARSGAAVGLGAVLVLMGFGWLGPVVGLIVGMAAAAVLLCHSDWSGIQLKINREILNKLAQYGVPISVAVALLFVISGSDRYLIAWYLGEASAGVYSVAVDFVSQTLTLLMMVVYMAVFPLAVRAYEHEGKAAAQEQMKSNATLLLLLGIPCVVGIVILAPGIANVFLGRNFRAAAVSIMPLIAIGAFLAGFKAYHYDTAFQFSHRTVHQVWIILIAAVANFVLNIIAIPRWGINGSAVASLVAYCVSIVLTAWIGRKHFELPFPIAPAVTVLTAGASMGAVLYPLRAYISPPAVIGQIGLGAVVYSVVLLAFDFMGLRGKLIQRLAPAASHVRLPEPVEPVAQGNVVVAQGNVV